MCKYAVGKESSLSSEVSIMSQCVWTTRQLWVFSIAFVLILVMMSILSYLFFVEMLGASELVMIILIFAFDAVALGGGVHVLRTRNRPTY